MKNEKFVEELSRQDDANDADVQQVLKEAAEKFTARSSVLLTFMEVSPTGEELNDPNLSREVKTIIGGNGATVLALFGSLLAALPPPMLAKVTAMAMRETGRLAEKLRNERKNQNRD